MAGEFARWFTLAISVLQTSVFILHFTPVKTLQLRNWDWEKVSNCPSEMQVEVGRECAYLQFRLWGDVARGTGERTRTQGQPHWQKTYVLWDPISWSSNNKLDHTERGRTHPNLRVQNLVLQLAKPNFKSSPLKTALSLKTTTHSYW